MDSGEIGTWVGNGITLLSLILFVVVERERLFSRKKARQQNPTSNLIDIGILGNLRPLVYTRILLGLILGFAINRLLVWLLLNYATLGGFLYNLNQPLVVMKVLISSSLAVLFGLFFELVFVRYSADFKRFYYHWFERTIFIFVVLSIHIESFSVRPDNYGNFSVFGQSAFWSLLVGVLIMLFVSFPLSPLEIVTVIMKRWRELIRDTKKNENASN